MQRAILILLALAVMQSGRTDAATVATAETAGTTTAVVFEGLGLEGFTGADSIASALRRSSGFMP